jgi:hypothetical protein
MESFVGSHIFYTVRTWGAAVLRPYKFRIVDRFCKNFKARRQKQSVVEVDAWASWGAAVLRPYMTLLAGSSMETVASIT